MKFLDSFKHYTTEEDAEILAELHEDSPENSTAIRHKCWDNYAQGMDKGVLVSGLCLLGSYGVVKGIEFIANHRKK